MVHLQIQPPKNIEIKAKHPFDMDAHPASAVEYIIQDHDVEAHKRRLQHRLRELTNLHGWETRVE
jgi:hypothetical protein